MASVLDALNGGSLNNLFGSLIYTSDTLSPQQKLLNRLESISKSQIRTNGSILPGSIDSLVDETELFGGYEDQDTWEEMKTQEERDAEEEAFNPCPILVVSIPEMPKGALVEVEVITSTIEATKCLDMRDVTCSMECTHEVPYTGGTSVGWESGHDFPTTLPRNEGIRINSFARVLGGQCAAAVLVTASHSTDESSNNCEIQPDLLFGEMLSSAKKALSEARANLNTDHIAHVRLFCVSPEKSTNAEYLCLDDGFQLRSALRNAISSKVDHNHPASSIIPVKAIDTIGLLPQTSSDGSGAIMFAMQVLLLDPVHLETEIWINKDR